MIILKKPYFMENEEWYTVVENGDRGYILTDKAPKKAVDSYNEYYKEIEMQDKMRPLFGLKKR